MLSIAVFIRNKKYFSSAFFYSCFSLVFSTWVTYIPYVADKLKISIGEIGGALFFSSLGSFVMIPICKALIQKYGVGRMTFCALIFYSFSIFGPFLAFNYITLCLSLFLFGFANGSMAITINSLTATIEKQDKVFIMSGSHGFFSAGGMIGAGLGGVLAAWLNNPFIHITIVVGIIIAIQVYFKEQYYYLKGEAPAEKKGLVKSLKPLVMVAIVGLIIMVSEGAIADWSALYLKTVTHTSLAFIGLGYAGFSFAMTVGRFLGDGISKKFGSWQLIAGCTFISLGGFALVLVAHSLVSIIGFTIIGFGFSVIVPEVFRVASKMEGVETSAGVSFIAGTANVGFLIGPVCLGLLAEMKTLHFSFLVLSCIVLVAFLISAYKYMQVQKANA